MKTPFITERPRSDKNFRDIQQNVGGALGQLIASGIRFTAGSAAPTSGTWGRGDVCFNTTPSAGGTPGWTCIAAGTPGTWKAMANVAS